MPFAAFCANYAWEILFSFIFPYEQLQQTINIIWFGLDTIILCQFIMYSKYQLHPKYRYQKWVILLSSLTLSFLLILGITIEFNDYIGKYSAFAINLMMSLLFIRMVLTQGILSQSIAIAFTKMLGTILASVLFYSLYPGSLLLLIMYFLIFTLDVIYIILIRKQTMIVVRRANSNRRSFR